MPEDTCAPRIASLSEQAKALERRASDSPPSKTTTSSPSAPTPPTSTRYAVTYTPRSTTATPKRAKGVLQAMIDGLRVDARDQIEPTFPRARGSH
jgi:hypothetical protein